MYAQSQDIYYLGDDKHLRRALVQSIINSLSKRCSHAKPMATLDYKLGVLYGKGTPKRKSTDILKAATS